MRAEGTACACMHMWELYKLLMVGVGKECLPNSLQVANHQVGQQKTGAWSGTMASIQASHALH